MSRVTGHNLFIAITLTLIFIKCRYFNLTSLTDERHSRQPRNDKFAILRSLLHFVYAQNDQPSNSSLADRLRRGQNT